ncbi:MAG TPA: thiamine pyrophosphate-binding protein [Terriglobia bacterium]|nr:thiamine pyrophosphate-binding protein [Terriglobia bacterium]
MNKSRKFSAGRRKFLKGAAVAGAASLAAPTGVAQNQLAQPQRATAVPVTAPGAETGTPPEVDVLTADRCGSDFMVDVVKSLDIEYFCSNPGSSFRALHESVINYGGNSKPEFITCCHEESSVGMAHGYAKIEGKPLGVLAHGTVGLQHASMAIFNAYCDRVPMYIIVGNTIDATMRRPGVEWIHSVQDAAAMVRDYIKWDDLPISLQHFAESAVRAYKITMTPPMGPVVLVADSELQERPIDASDKLRTLRLTKSAPPQGDSGAVAEAARYLVAAENPVIIADRAARTQAGVKYLVELAETLQAPVIDQGGRMNFPSQHPLNHSDRGRAAIAEADVILGLELTDFWGAVNAFRDQLHRTSRPITKAGAKLISISASDLYTKSNYQDFQRFPEVDVSMAADSEATLPALTEAVRRLVTADRRNAFQARAAKLANAKQALTERLRADATYAWDATPISTARMAAELWAQIKNEDWSLVSPTLGGWPQRFWTIDKHYQFIGGPGGYGVGYCAPAATGAALANKKYGRLSVNFQPDGDLMYAPGVLWTAAHHRIPLLSIMHNNRAYHQEVMHLQRMSNRHQRGIERAGVGTTLQDPDINYAQLAKSMGLYAEGPIGDPKDLGPAIKRAIAAVKRGEPALLDVVTQPR